MHSFGCPAGNVFWAGSLSRMKYFFIRVIGSESGVKLKSPAIKKSREWGVSGHLEAAIWARKRAEGLQKGNHKEKQQLQDITGTWDFPSGTVQIKDPKEFRMEGESMTFEYLRSLNDSVHLFHIQETKQKKMVTRINNLLLIIPYDCRGPFQEGVMKP